MATNCRAKKFKSITNVAEINMDSLQNLCINSIVENFSLFYVLSFTNDPELQHNFEFLQRRYSIEIASELHKRNKLWDEYITFIINKHLKFLDGKWLSYVRDYSFGKMRIYRFPIEEAFRHLPNLVRMEFLDICNDEILANVGKFCPEIVEIDMRNSSVTDTGVKHLCIDENGQVPCPKLKHLLIEKTNVTDEGLTCLIKYLLSLETIDSPNISEILYSLHSEDFGLENVHRHNLVRLDMLKLDKIEWNTDLLKVCFTVCPRIESLACCIFNEEQLGVIKNDLDRLHLKFIKKGRNVNINPFLKIKGSNLTCLNIYNCIVSISILAASCPKLKELCISNVTFIDDDGDQQLITFNNLVECAFKYTKDVSSTNKAIASLFSSKKLESVSFSFCDMSNNMRNLILHGCKNLNIKVISFECLIFEGRFMMDILSNCSTLTNLNLKRCDLGVGFDKDPLYKLAKSLPNKPVISPPHSSCITCSD